MPSRKLWEESPTPNVTFFTFGVGDASHRIRNPKSKIPNLKFFLFADDVV